MKENDSLTTPENASSRSIQSNTPPLDGVRYSTSTSEGDSESKPSVLERDFALTTSDGIDLSAEEGLGPSAFSGTERPYIARVFEMSSTEIMQLELGDSLDAVDDFIINEMQERGWKDTPEGYRDILAELKTNLGVNENLENLRALEILNKGIMLLQAQRMFRQRSEQIQEQINRLNK